MKTRQELFREKERGDAGDMKYEAWGQSSHNPLGQQPFLFSFKQNLIQILLLEFSFLEIEPSQLVFSSRLFNVDEL